MTTTLKKRKQRTGNKNWNTMKNELFLLHSKSQNGVFWCVKNPEPGHGVFKAKVYRVYQEVGDEEEEVGAAETSQQVVEDAWHWPDDGDDDGHHRDGGWRYWWWPSSSWLLCEFCKNLYFYIIRNSWFPEDVKRFFIKLFSQFSYTTVDIDIESHFLLHSFTVSLLYI